MIAWQYAAALWALPIAALPFLIHLLRTHHAKRVAFPSVRFVPASRTAAVRLRSPSDVWLMLLRIAIVALAVAALARPMVLTEARTSAWNARTARAVVVDTSDSMRMPDDSGAAPAEAASEAAAAELRTATYGRRIEARDLDEGVARASRWLLASPPARREVVVISDLQRGTFGRARGMVVADGIGVRFVAIGRPAATKAFDGAPLFGAGDIDPRGQTVEATVDATAAVTEARPSRSTEGLRLTAAPGSERDVARLLRAVASAGAPAPSAQQPMAVQFAGATASVSAPLAPVRRGWMLNTVLRLGHDPAVASPSSKPESSDGLSTVPDPWTILAWNPDGSPRVRAAASDNELILDVAALPGSLFAAAVVQAVLTARVGVTGYGEYEPARLEEKTLSAWSRPPASVTRDAWRTAESSDARWCWLLALVLLAVEQWLRGRPARQLQQEVTRAAA
jgi:hypothetical protein